VTVPSPAQLFGERHADPRPAAGSRIPGPGRTPDAAARLVAVHATGPMPRLGPDRRRVEEAGEHVAQKWILTRGRDNIRDLLPGPILPPVIDKELLVDAEKELGLSLRPYQEAREWLRDAFWERVHREFGIGGSGKSPLRRRQQLQPPGRQPQDQLAASGLASALPRSGLHDRADQGAGRGSSRPCRRGSWPATSGLARWPRRWRPVSTAESSLTTARPRAAGSRGPGGVGRVAFMTAPTRTPAAATLPSRILAATSGLAAIALDGR
jgi:hypothetical protein